MGEILNGDCLELMDYISDSSIDMILCDLPYGTTACKWDTIIPFDKLWAQYERIIKPNGAIVLTAAQPFTSALVMSKIKLFKYTLVWDKVAVTNPMLAKKQPMRCHEEVCVFYKKPPTYNPQMREGIKWSRAGKKHHTTGTLGKSKLINSGSDESGIKYPKSILTFSNANKTTNTHPTQKPVALFEYLIKTYTNAGDLVLDNCAGSGTTAIACINTNRNFIVMEQDEKYFELMKARITQHAELF